jgi:hypothetical protein
VQQTWYVRNDQIAGLIYDVLVTAFNEDRDMIGAQARNIALSRQTNPNHEVEMLPLSMDAALIQYRRIVDSALATETRG